MIFANLRKGVFFVLFFIVMKFSWENPPLKPPNHLKLYCFVAGILMLSVSISCSSIKDYFSGIGKKIEPHSGKSPLNAVKFPPSGVVIDFYRIRVPYLKRHLAEELWNEAEEMDISPELRNQLRLHGFRQGRLGTRVPASLLQLLELKDDVIKKPYVLETKLSDAAVGEPLCTRFTGVNMVKDQPVEFNTADIMPSLPVLAIVNGKPVGREYRNAQGKIRVTTDEQPDGSVILTTVPEIHYGEETRKMIAVGGVLSSRTVRPKQTFDQLTVKTKLLLGQWVLIGPTMKNEGGFGNKILSRDMGDPEQILIAIRLVKTQKDGVHDRNDIPILKIRDSKTSEEQNHEDEDDLELPPDISAQELGSLGKH